MGERKIFTFWAKNFGPTLQSPNKSDLIDFSLSLSLFSVFGAFIFVHEDYDSVLLLARMCHTLQRQIKVYRSTFFSFLPDEEEMGKY